MPYPDRPPAPAPGPPPAPAPAPGPGPGPGPALQKQRIFVSEPMGNKPVFHLSGINQILGQKLAAAGFPHVSRPTPSLSSRIRCHISHVLGTVFLGSGESYRNISYRFGYSDIKDITKL